MTPSAWPLGIMEILAHRVGAGGQHAEQGVAGLVEGGALPLLGREHDPPDGAEEDLLQRGGEVGHGDLAMALAGCRQGGLVDQVLQVGTDHTRGRGGQGVEVDAGGQGDAPGVDGQDLAPPGLVRRGHGHPAVETARAQQGRVEDLGPVGGGQHHDAFTAGETVHLGEDSG